MTEPPPPRWKVVERGRRLEVVDTRAERGAPATRGSALRPGLPRRLRFDGTLGWTTHAFYDAGGPRAVVLDGALARWIVGMIAAAGIAAIGAVAAIVAVVGTGALPFLAVVAMITGRGGKRFKPWLTRRIDLIAVP